MVGSGWLCHGEGPKTIKNQRDIISTREVSVDDFVEALRPTVEVELIQAECWQATQSTVVGCKAVENNIQQL